MNTEFSHQVFNFYTAHLAFVGMLVVNGCLGFGTGFWFKSYMARRHARKVREQERADEDPEMQRVRRVVREIARKQFPDLVR